MSKFSNIRISKGGKLLADKWIYNEETKRGKTEKDVDVSDKAKYFLMDDCSLMDNVTFKDILLLVESLDQYDFLSPLLTRGPWLEELVDEGLSPNLFNKKSVDQINIGWRCSLQDDFYDDRTLLESYVDIYGKCDNDSDRYGIGFTPLYELQDCKLVLNEKIAIEDERRASNENRALYLKSLSEEERNQESYYPIITKAYKKFTLFEILHGLFWELSFHGGPEDRDKLREELSERVARIQSGEAKTYTWEEVKERLKANQGEDE